ncbi:MAG: hypothetical protein ACR2PH_04360 [Desulfobulbia bacterium]
MMTTFENFRTLHNRTLTEPDYRNFFEFYNLHPHNFGKLIKTFEWLEETYPEHPLDFDKYKDMWSYVHRTYKPNAREIERFMQSISPNQMASKLWLASSLELCDYLNDPFYSVDCEIVGSWAGNPLIHALRAGIDFKRISCWDMDYTARMLHNGWKRFDRDDAIIYPMDYFAHRRAGSDATLLINTSSEHMTERFADMRAGKSHFFRKNPIIVIQSNNMYSEEDHVNCVKSTQELIEKHGLRKVYYRGHQPMLTWGANLEIKQSYSDDSNLHRRFMIIGRLSR